MGKEFLLLSILLGSQAYAVTEKDCGSVDLREPGQSMYQAPSFHQGDSSFCWAYAGTQLATALINKENQNKFKYQPQDIAISPTASLVQVSEKDKSCPVPCEIVNMVLTEKRGCSYKDVTTLNGTSRFHPDTGEPISNYNSCQGDVTISEVMGTLFGVYNSVTSRMLDEDHDDQLTTQIQEQISGSNLPERQRAMITFLTKRFGAGGVSVPQLYGIATAPKCVSIGKNDFKFVGSERVNEVLESASLSRPSCTAYRSQKMAASLVEDSPQCPRTPPSKIAEPQDLMGKIHQSFNSAAVYPVAIDYCFAFLKEGEPVDGPQLCQFKNPAKDKSGKVIPTSDHKSLLIGRKYNKATKQCEFLLRNTWGKDCALLHEKFQQSCEEEKAKYGSADVWIPEAILGKVVHGISVIE